MEILHVHIMFYLHLFILRAASCFQIESGLYDKTSEFDVQQLEMEYICMVAKTIILDEWHTM